MKLKNKAYLLFAGLLTMQFILLIKLKFTAWPEMLLWPYLNIHGWQLYHDIAVAHSPLLLWKLDIFYMIFGVGVLQLKIFTWILILIFDIFVYFLSSKIWSKKIAIVALGFFAFWQIFFEGNGLWFDLFMGGIAFGAFYFVQRKKWFWAGLFFALAAISKQTAVWFMVPIAIGIFDDKKDRIWGNIGSIIKGVMLVGVPFILILLFFGILPDFWNWAIKFGIFELPRAQGQVQLPDLKNLAISLFPFTVFLPLFLMKKKETLGLFLWSLAGMMGAYPRFEYFHFQPAIPYLAIASALVFASSWNKNELAKAFVPIYIIGCLYLFGGFFMRNFGEGTRFYESGVQHIVSYIKSNTSPGDKIFIMNYWDSIYALSGTFPATRPWVPQLSWYMDATGVQEKMAKDLESSKPKLVIENPNESVGLGAYKPVKVTDYVFKNYKLKERIDTFDILIPK